MSAEQREAWRAEMPELPAERRHRYAEQLGLSQYDARVLTEERAMADYFEAAVAAGAEAKAAANWLSGDIAAYVNANRLSYDTLANLSDAAIRTEFHDRAGKLVAKDDRWPVGKFVMPDVDVRAADAARGDLNLHLASLWFRLRHVAEFEETFPFLRLNECFHWQ